MPDTSLQTVAGLMQSVLEHEDDSLLQTLPAAPAEDEWIDEEENRLVQEAVQEAASGQTDNWESVKRRLLA